MAQVENGTAKVLVIGPCESGKSCVSDYVAEFVEGLGRDGYEPTVGVRSVFESSALRAHVALVHIDAPPPPFLILAV